MQWAGVITDVNAKNENELRTLAERVKWARGQRKLSQAELGKRAGVSQGTIGNIESGERKKPRELVAIAGALQVNPQWLDKGRGEWEAQPQSPTAQEPGAVFQAPTADEMVMLTNYRKLLDKDRRQFAEKIGELAEERQAEFDEFSARYGVNTAAERAHARRARAATTTTVDPNDPVLKQRRLFGDGTSG